MLLDCVDICAYRLLLVCVSLARVNFSGSTNKLPLWSRHRPELGVRAFFPDTGRYMLTLEY